MMLPILLGFLAILQSENALAIALENNREMSPIFMAVGEQRVFPMGEIERYSVSGAGSLTYTRLPPGNRLLLKAVKPGLATLFLQRKGQQNESRTIRIELKKNTAITHSMYHALNGLNEVEAIDSGDHFILRGEVKTFSEAKKVAYLRDQFPKNIQNETEISERWSSESEGKISALIKNYPTLKLVKTEGDLWVNGSLTQQKIADVVIKKLKLIQPLVQTDIKALNDQDPTIYFKVFLLEVKKEKSQKFGVNWPETLSGKLQISPLDWSGGNSLDLTLDAMAKDGKVNVLSAPELVVRAPGQAEIFAGGELPIRLKTKNTDIVTWKNIGLLLKLEIQSLAGNQVRLNVETELSFLDENYKNDDIPGVLSNHIKTQVDSTLGKPLLLSGLLQEESRNQVQGLPGLSSIPVLGKLFGSESFRKHKSEFVAILLPYNSLPSHPMSRIQSDIPKGFLPLPRESNRESVSSDSLQEQKEHSQYPWNVL